jgi:ribosomal protein S18 acetylase RimI-like enzyme
MIRPAEPGDSDAVTALAVAAEMFAPQDAGIVEELLRSFFAEGRAAGHGCLVDEDGGAVVAAAYVQPRGIADRVWDLTMIAVDPREQGRGRGTALLRRVEDDLRARGQRLLLVDTSGTTAYDRTRTFYARCGYDEEARVRDFWEPGDDLVIFRKALAA